MLRRVGPDLFNVYAITITANVHMLLKYARDYHHPAANRDAVNPGSSDSYRSRQWAGYLSYLEDECTALAYLTKIVAAMPLNNLEYQKELNVETLDFKVKSVKLLRQRFRTSTNEPNLFHAVGLLLGAAFYSRHFETAKHHAAILAQLFQT